MKENNLIVVGNVSSQALAKTKMAKSVLDAGWYRLKTQFDYKSKGMQAVFIEDNEAYTSQTCSCCGAISRNSPKENGLVLSVVQRMIATLMRQRTFSVWDIKRPQEDVNIT